MITSGAVTINKSAPQTESSQLHHLFIQSTKMLIIVRNFQDLLFGFYQFATGIARVRGGGMNFGKEMFLCCHGRPPQPAGFEWIQQRLQGWECGAALEGNAPSLPHFWGFTLDLVLILKSGILLWKGKWGIRCRGCFITAQIFNLFFYFIFCDFFFFLEGLASLFFGLKPAKLGKNPNFC